MQRDELLRVVTADTDWMINITKNDQIGRVKNIFCPMKNGNIKAEEKIHL